MRADHQVLPTPTATGVSAVRLRRITRLFDGLPAVLQVQLEIGLGEVVWLRGSNGSGKSTLLRLIATVLSPTYGEGSVLGLDLLTERDRIRGRVELLGHQSRLYGNLTAAENLRFASHLHGLGRQDPAPVLARVGLEEVAAVRVARFSQGMRQRLALARCLMRDPDLVLLDEPYAGLDTDARVLVDDILADARARGATVVLASHEAPPAHLLGREVWLDAGRVVQTTSAPRVRTTS